MAGETALSKKIKISKAQQYIIISVLAASLFLGVAIALVLHFVKLISFNTDVIIAQDKSINSYSHLIQTIGICKAPANGNTYTIEELNKCNPDSVEVSSVPGSLRAKILTTLADNPALNSVPKNTDTNCINSETDKNYTYDELNQIYNDANTSEELKSASQLIKTCSALRVIPDALPKHKNEDALLSSLNRLFIISDWEPESISPSDSSSVAAFGTKLNTISVSLSIESSATTTMTVLNNIEHSIREFNIERATIEWSGEDSISLRAQASAYYVNPSTINDTSITITGEN